MQRGPDLYHSPRPKRKYYASHINVHIATYLGVVYILHSIIYIER